MRIALAITIYILKMILYIMLIFQDVRSRIFPRGFVCRRKASGVLLVRKRKKQYKAISSPRKYYLGDFFVSSLDIIKDEVVKTGLRR